MGPWIIGSLHISSIRDSWEHLGGHQKPQKKPSERPFLALPTSLPWYDNKLLAENWRRGLSSPLLCNIKYLTSVHSDLWHFNLAMSSNIENVQTQSMGSESQVATLDFSLKMSGSTSRLIWRHISNHVGNYVEIHDLGIDRVTNFA